MRTKGWQLIVEDQSGKALRSWRSTEFPAFIVKVQCGHRVVSHKKSSGAHRSVTPAQGSVAPTLLSLKEPKLTSPAQCLMELGQQ